MASSTLISRVVTGVFCTTISLAIFSASSSSSAEIGLGCENVEAQPVGADQRPLLRDMGSQNLAQRLVDKMGRGMVGAQAGAARVIDLQLGSLACPA